MEERYWSFKEIMQSKDLSIAVKSKLFNTCALPVLTYGCQTWALTKTHLNKLEVCQRAMERSMIGAKRMDKIRNENIRKLTKVEDIIK